MIGGPEAAARREWFRVYGLAHLDAVATAVRMGIAAAAVAGPWTASSPAALLGSFAVIAVTIGLAAWGVLSLIVAVCAAVRASGTGAPVRRAVRHAASLTAIVAAASFALTGVLALTAAEPAATLLQAWPRLVTLVALLVGIPRLLRLAGGRRPRRDMDVATSDERSCAVVTGRTGA